MEGGACVVVDLGSGSVKAEFASAEVPKVIQNVVGSVKHKAAIPHQQLEGLVDDMYFVGNDVQKHRGLLKLAHPISHGHVTDWEGLTRVLNYTNSVVGVPTKDHPIMITEPMLASRPQRHRLAQILFEEQQHPAVMFAAQGLLSLYSTGNTTGLVLDVGDGVTHACPVFEGYSIRDAVRRVDLGGRDVTTYLQLLLRMHGHNLDTSAEYDIVRLIKEQRCHVATFASKGTDFADATAPKVRHRLPDGSEITLGIEQSAAPEALFNPALVGKECASVVQVAHEAVRKSDIDLRRSLYENLYLAGGSTLFNNFCSRFLGEMTKLTPRDCKVRLMAPAERMYTTWIGGSFLAQLSTFKSMAVKKAEYLEEGERVLHSRLFC